MKKVFLFASVLLLSACTTAVVTEETPVVDSTVVDSIVVVEGATGSVAVDSVK